jgi:peptidoglycan L-alanyl-D-glutamate endopeptidase CwlK
MPSFGEASRRRLLTCDPRIAIVCNDVIRFMDFAVTHGHRSHEKQDALYAKGRTLPGGIVTYARGGQSNHNIGPPSPAFDLAPWPIDWDDESRFIELAGAIRYAAWVRSITLEWGGHWPGRKRDLPHFQIPRSERS